MSEAKFERSAWWNMNISGQLLRIVLITAFCMACLVKTFFYLRGPVVSYGNKTLSREVYMPPDVHFKSYSPIVSGLSVRTHVGIDEYRRIADTMTNHMCSIDKMGTNIVFYLEGKDRVSALVYVASQSFDFDSETSWSNFKIDGYDMKNNFLVVTGHYKPFWEMYFLVFVVGVALSFMIAAGIHLWLVSRFKKKYSDRIELAVEPSPSGKGILSYDRVKQI